MGFHPANQHLHATALKAEAIPPELVCKSLCDHLALQT